MQYSKADSDLHLSRIESPILGRLGVNAMSTISNDVTNVKNAVRQIQTTENLFILDVF